MDASVEKAADFFEEFHWGIPPKKIKHARMPPKPNALTELGKLEAVVYSTKKEGDGFAHYEHEFGEDGGRKPTLAVDPESKKLHVVGGDYSVEGRGIVD